MSDDLFDAATANPPPRIADWARPVPSMMSGLHPDLRVPVVDHMAEVPVSTIFPAADPRLLVLVAQETLKGLIGFGADCPCCGRLVRLTTISLRTGKALTLIRMYAHHRRTRKIWIHMIRDINNFGLSSRDYGSLEHWGLCEPKSGGKEDGNPDSGFWKLTRRGEDFVLGRITLPLRVVVYRERLICVSREQTDIRKALGTGFNYDAEINGTW
jgi:hypothetical protein